MQRDAGNEKARTIWQRFEAQEARYTRQKVARVIVRVESNEVAIEDTQEDFSSNRENSGEGRELA